MNRIALLTDVVKHLQTQGEKSISFIPERVCLYRKDKSAACPIRCAIGALISDEIYNPVMEYKSYEELIVSFPEVQTSLEEKYGKFSEEDIDYVTSIQIRLHDSMDITEDSLKSLTLESAAEILRKH